MNWSDIKDALRIDLKDDGSTKKFSDETLYTFWVDAVRDYSGWFPYIPAKEELSGSGTGPYTLPTDFSAVIFVEVPENRFLEERRPRPGVRYPTRSTRPFYWYLMGGSLYLDTSPLDTDGVYLTYEAVHDIPDSIDDDTHITSIPDRDLELPRLYVQAKVYSQMRTRQAALDRFKTRVSAGNTREDNPLDPEVDTIMNEYYAKIAERIPGGVVKLSRPGRMR
jgi:hypothetical protein